MAQVQRHRRAIAAALLGLAALAFAPALAQDQGSKDGTDLYDRPVLAIDPGMHTAKIRSQAVDAAGRFAVTGGDDRTVRIWSIADGKLLRTIWIPVGPEYVGVVYAVAISPDGSTIAAGGWTERLRRHVRSIYSTASPETSFSEFTTICPMSRISSRSRRTAATSPQRSAAAMACGSSIGTRIGARRSATTNTETTAMAQRSRATAVSRRRSYDGLIRLYTYDPNSDSPNFRRVGEPVKAPSGHRPHGVAFSPDGKRLAVGYYDVAAVDILDGTTLERVGGHKPADVEPNGLELANVAWSRDGQTLFAAGGVRGRPRPTSPFRVGSGRPRRRAAHDLLRS